MQTKSSTESGTFSPRLLFAFALCAVGTFLAMFSFAGTPPAESSWPMTATAPAQVNFLGRLSSMPPDLADVPNTVSGSDPAPVSQPLDPSRNSRLVDKHTNGSAFTAASASTAAIWQVVSSPNPSASAAGDFLNSVACVDANDCWAVGYGEDQYLETLAEHWDGKSWKIVNTPGPTPGPDNAYNVLSAVTCSAGADCWAVGYSCTNVRCDALTEHWDGSSWARIASPKLSGVGSSYLRAVVCGTGSDCWAVGYGYADGSSTPVGVTEHWDGNSWALVNSGSTDPTQNNYLNGVSCVGASNCWAVGYSSSTSPPSTSQALIEHWDGSSWTITPTSLPPAPNARLWSVACNTTSDCWAVGDTSLPTGDVPSQTLTEHFDGSSWQTVSSPNASLTQYNLLFGVTCVSGSDCWAVGYTEPGAAGSGTPQPITEQWNGSSWTIISSPSRTPGLDSLFYGVACVSATNCWAVGTDVPDTFDPPQTLIEQYAVPPVSLNSVVSRKTHGAAGNFDINTPHSDLLSRDTFTYPNGNLAGNDNWTQSGSTAGTPIQVTSGHAVIGGSGPGSTNNLTRTYPHADGTSIYAAFDLTITAATADNGYGDFFFYYFAGTWNDRLYAKALGNGFVLGLQSSTADVVTFGTTVLSPNKTYRVVLAWNFIAGAQNDTMSIYVDPIDPAVELNNSAYVNYTWTTGGQAEPTAITDVRLRQGSGGGPNASIDNLAIGSSFGAVAALRDPAPIECRSGGTSGDYTVIFKFANSLASVSGASVSSGSGAVRNSVIDTNDSHNYVVNLGGVTNAQVITLNLADVADSLGNFNSAVFASMGVLLGDTTGDGVVNSADISQVRRQTGQVTTEANKRTDLTVDGVINSADITAVRRQTGTALPQP